MLLSRMLLNEDVKKYYKVINNDESSFLLRCVYLNH